MASFNGKWITDGKIEKYDEFMDKCGATDLKEKLRDCVTTLQYTVNGKQWTLKASMDAFPGEKTYTFTEGEEYEGTGLDGTPITGKLTKINENETVDEQVYGKYGKMTTTRTIEGDAMTAVTELDGLKMITKMKRV